MLVDPQISVLDLVLSLHTLCGFGYCLHVNNSNCQMCISRLDLSCDPNPNIQLLVYYLQLYTVLIFYCCLTLSVLIQYTFITSWFSWAGGPSMAWLILLLSILQGWKSKSALSPGSFTEGRIPFQTQVVDAIQSHVAVCCRAPPFCWLLPEGHSQVLELSSPLFPTTWTFPTWLLTSQVCR